MDRVADVAKKLSVPLARACSGKD